MRDSSARFIPVAMPSFAASAWMSIPITLANKITHSSEYPYLAPAVMFVAKLPGSTYAMLAMNAGPRNGRTARSPRVRPWIASNAAIWTSGCGCAARSAVEYERSIQTDRYHGREGGMQLGQPVIDCDIHASVPKIEALF